MQVKRSEAWKIRMPHPKGSTRRNENKVFSWHNMFSLLCTEHVISSENHLFNSPPVLFSFPFFVLLQLYVPFALSSGTTLGEPITDDGHTILLHGSLFIKDNGQSGSYRTENHGARHAIKFVKHICQTNLLIIQRSLSSARFFGEHSVRVKAKPHLL